MGRGSASQVTMNQLAETCGLSHATVSFVLRGRRDRSVSPATRERVFAAAVQRRYQPQRHYRLDAAKLKVLFVCPEYNIAYGVPSFPGRVMAELARRQAESQIQFQLTSTERQSMMETLFRGVCEGGADAVILTRVAECEVAEVTAVCPVPVVVLGTGLNDAVPGICMDNGAIGRQAAVHLWDCGHRHVLLLSVPHGVGDERVAGFREEWTRRSGGTRIPEVWHDSFDELGGAHHGARFLEQRQPLPTAIFAVSDSIAYGFIQVLGRAGRSVPDYVSILGCDDLPYSAWSWPAISSFALAEAEAAEQLIRILGVCCGRTEGGARRAEIHPRLVERESVRRLPV